MTIDPTASTAQATQTTSKSQQSQVKLSSDISSFLTLLTTQLKNQDPLKPVDSTEFTSQLAQFANVEQGIQTNSNLEKLISMSGANQALTAVGYLGKYVEAESDTTALTGGKADFGYTLPQNAAGVAVQIATPDGVAVRTLPGDVSQGKHTISWDGKDANGLSLPDGQYKFVVKAVDADGKEIQTKAFTAGIADGVEGSGADAQVTVNGVKVPLLNVMTVKTDPPTA